MPGEVADAHLNFDANAAAALLLGDVGEVNGQRAVKHGESKSMLAAAYEMDDCPKETTLNRDKLVDRDIKDKKKDAAKKRISVFYVKRLDPGRGVQRYSDYENKLNRLKQQVMMQNQFYGSDGNRSLTYDGEDLAEYILRNIPVDFDEVTEQDNALEYMLAVEDFEAECTTEEIQQVKKMLLRLEGKGDEKHLKKAQEFKKKLSNLEEQLQFFPAFKKALSKAQGILRRSHEQEIHDGYNLIPKAADLLKDPIKINGRERTATDVAAFFRDSILCCDNFLEVFDSIVTICMGTDENKLIATP
jgi:hypothetical protein